MPESEPSNQQPSQQSQPAAPEATPSAPSAPQQADPSTSQLASPFEHPRLDNLAIRSTEPNLGRGEPDRRLKRG
jgi:hypothetical protein